MPQHKHSAERGRMFRPCYRSMIIVVCMMFRAFSLFFRIVHDVLPSVMLRRVLTTQPLLSATATFRIVSVAWLAFPPLLSLLVRRCLVPLFLSSSLSLLSLLSVLCSRWMQHPQQQREEERKRERGRWTGEKTTTNAVDCSVESANGIAV
jgi:hypothetical protein